jgi:hypothetical protein
MRIYQCTAWRGGIVALALVCASGSTGAAQWLTTPTPGIPRTPDGKPDLNAPTPRTADGKPDLTGQWGVKTYEFVNYLLPQGTLPPMQPWAADLMKKRISTQSHELPMTFCMPHGVPDAMLVVAHPFKIFQTPRAVVHLYEEMTKYRQIHTDGRTLPVDPNPTWYGYSVGRWEGDTFVVETAGFREGSWLTNQGIPHTDALRTTERFRRINVGKMELEVTIDDPKAFTRPWTSRTIEFFAQPDTELIEHLCENNKDVDRLQQIYGTVEGAPGSGRR